MILTAGMAASGTAPAANVVGMRVDCRSGLRTAVEAGSIKRGRETGAGLWSSSTGRQH
jgi:hypothetical protein